MAGGGEVGGESVSLSLMSKSYGNVCITQVGRSADCMLLVPNGSLTVVAFTAAKS